MLGGEGFAELAGTEGAGGFPAGGAGGLTGTGIAGLWRGGAGGTPVLGSVPCVGSVAAA